MSGSDSEYLEHAEGTVQLPAPTSDPIVLAAGMSLMITGLLTHWAISALGLLLLLKGAVGWFREVLPHEHHELVELGGEEIVIQSRRIHVKHLPIEDHRKVLPFETYTIMAGVKGGIAGGIAMLVPALLFGLIKYHSIWYPVNLLAAGGFTSWAGQSTAFLSEFHLDGFLAALAIHSVTSLLIGLLYGAMLPMFPRKPILTAGFMAPLLWTGILYSALGVISPILNERINWGWFIASQAAFGLVAGFVVNLQVKVRTEKFQELPFAIRAGLETGPHRAKEVDDSDIGKGEGQ
jgi:hypothetical protein